MQPHVWYELWLDRPADLRAHATPTRAAESRSGGGIRRGLGRALIQIGQVLAAEPREARRRVA